MQVVPEDVKPISFRGDKLDRGPAVRTSYEDALRATLAAIQAAPA